MKALITLVSVVAFCAAAAAAELSSDHPVKRLDYLVGEWTIAGEDGYRETCRWAPGGDAVICETSGGFSILGYSSAQGAYTHHGLSRDGEIETLYGWFEGAVLSFVGQSTRAGEHQRSKVTLTPTERGFRFQQEVSVKAGPWGMAHDFEYVRLPGQASSPLLPGNAGNAECAWPAERDAVAAAPQHHTVLFENEQVRVLDVVVLPGIRQPVHAHCWPSVLYVTSGLSYVDYDHEGKVLFDSRTAPAPSFPLVEWMGPQAPHAVHNLGDDPVHLIRVELKR